MVAMIARTEDGSRDRGELRITSKNENMKEDKGVVVASDDWQCQHQET